MPNSKDARKVINIIRKFLRKKSPKYILNPEIFPEIEVRKFLNIIDNNQSCCDGLAERSKQYWTSKNLKDYILVEIKGKNIDSRHRDLGQTQINSTMKFFGSNMFPYKGYLFVKEGSNFIKKGFLIRKGELFKKNGMKKENLENNVPLRVYYYDHNYNPYRR
jgi:hypothetical protein